MPRPSESSCHLCSQRRVAVLVVAALIAAARPIAADGEKTPIRRTGATESVQQEPLRRTSGGTTLVFLGLLLGGAIVIRRVVQRRQNWRPETGRSGSIETLWEQRIDGELTIRVLRIGRRVLVVGSCIRGLATLSEISDPEEIAALTGRTSHADSDALFDGHAAIQTAALASLTTHDSTRESEPVTSLPSTETVTSD